VGTHADLVKKGELANLVKEMETLYPIPTKSTRSQIQGHFAVTLSGGNKTKLMQLKDKLVELALNHPKIGVGQVRVPCIIGTIQQELEKLKKNTPYLVWSDYTTLCKQLGMVLLLCVCALLILALDLNEDRIPEITTMLHDLGLVVWHNVTRLRDVIVIDPQWLADALAGVVSFICQPSVARAAGMTNWSKMQEPLKLK
jgi:hypothetical protein